jgi:hypothetical protein
MRRLWCVLYFIDVNVTRVKQYVNGESFMFLIRGRIRTIVVVVTRSQESESCQKHLETERLSGTSHVYETWTIEFNLSLRTNGTTIDPEKLMAQTFINFPWSSADLSPNRHPTTLPNALTPS